MRYYLQLPFSFFSNVVVVYTWIIHFMSIGELIHLYQSQKAVCTLLAEAQPTLDNGLHVVNNKVEDNDVVMASSRDETNNSSAAENNEESGEEGMLLRRCY